MDVFLENNIQVIKPDYTGARVTVRLEPAGKDVSIPRPKTARQLLEYFGLREETAIIAREGKLLTPDRRIWPADNLFLRIVTSQG